MMETRGWKCGYREETDQMSDPMDGTTSSCNCWKASTTRVMDWDSHTIGLSGFWELQVRLTLMN